MADIFDQITGEDKGDIFDSVSAPKVPKGFLQKLLSRVETSALSPFERARISAGNRDGILDYLKNKGRAAEFKDGELFVDGKPADPDGLKSLLSLTIPGLALNAINGAMGREVKSPIEDIASLAIDSASDVYEAPSALLDMIGPGMGSAAGTTLGLATGPAAAVTSPALATILGGAGGFASEKMKQAIGERLGVYKTGGDYVTPEAENAGIVGAVSSYLPAQLEGLRGTGEWVSRKALEHKIPQRMYASSTGMKKELMENPERIDRLMADDVTAWTEESLKRKGFELGAAQKEALKKELASADDISEDQIRATLKKYLPTPAPGNIKQHNDAIDDVVREFSEQPIWQETTSKIPSGTDDFVAPDDAILRKAYEDQYGGKGKINLPMRRYKDTKTVPAKRPSFEEFKAEISQNSDDAIPFAERVLAKKKPDASRADEEALRRFYEEHYPATKEVTKVYPLPEGSVKTPTFEEWKAEQVAKYQKGHPTQSFKTIKNKVASALDLNEQKRVLQKAAAPRFGEDGYNVSKKDVQRALSSSIREEIEKAGGDKSKIAEINKKIADYFSLAKSVEAHQAANIGKPLISGADAVTAGLGGPGAVATKTLLSSIPGSVAFGTKGGSFLGKLLKKGASIRPESGGVETALINKILSDYLGVRGSEQ